MRHHAQPKCAKFTAQHYQSADHRHRAAYCGFHLSTQINFITNNVFLGRLGEQALGVAGITGVYYLIFAVIGYGLSNGLQALIARRAGQDRAGEIGFLHQHGVLMALLLSAVAIALSYTLGPLLLKLSMRNRDNYEAAVNFLKVRIWGLPFLYVYQTSNALLVGTNHSRLLVLGTAAETVANVFFDYGLIFGHLGMPSLGFNGAAYASILAELVGAAVVALVIRQHGVAKRFKVLQTLKFEPRQARLILVQSLPLMAQFGISIVTWEYFYLLIEHNGARDLALSNAMRNVFGLFGCFAWAFAATSNTMVSNIIGQNRQHLVIALVWKISKLSLSVALCVCVLANLLPGTLLGIYSQGADFVAYATPVMRTVSVALVLQSVAVVWLNAISGTGNTTINLGIELAAIVFYCIYVWLVLERWHWGIVWGWGSECLYWSLTFCLSFWYIQKGRWRRKAL